MYQPNLFMPMRKFILWIALIPLGLATGVKGQSGVITGKVVDARTKEPIPFAAVFFNGTFNGTSTDTLGKFEIVREDQQSIPLIISSLGYETYTSTDYGNSSSISIRLIPKEYELDEIILKEKSLVKQRKRNLKVFRRELLGTSSNAKQCAILNEDAIHFDYTQQGGDVKAFANEPIVIRNEALGYVIRYYLNDFFYDNKDRIVTYVGNMVFQEDLALSKGDQRRLDSRREKTYEGSSMHFFRSLWNNSLSDDEFEVFNKYDGRILRYNHIVDERANKKFIVSPANLEICHNRKCRLLRFLKPRVEFNKDGYYDPLGLLWLSTERVERVADTLPFEYQP